MSNTILDSHASGTSNAILVSHGWPAGSSFSNPVLASHGAPYSGGSDTYPDEFYFADIAGTVAVSTNTQSVETITVAGITPATPVAITISGSGGSLHQYSKNGAAYTSAAGTVVAGDTVRIQHTSSPSNSTAATTTLTIGGRSDTFTSTTVAASGSTLTHGASLTLSGLGAIFGTKPAQTPFYNWNGGASMPAMTETYATDGAVRASGARGVSTPNARITHFWSGRCNGTNPRHAGHMLNVPANGTDKKEFYFSMLHRVDPAWVSDAGSDQQMKPMEWAIDNTALEPDLYTSVAGLSDSAGDTLSGEWRIGPSFGTFAIPDKVGGGQYQYGDAAINPIRGWRRLHFVLRYDATTGLYYAWETTPLTISGTPAKHRRIWPINNGSECGTDWSFDDGVSPTYLAAYFGGYMRDYANPGSENNYVYMTNIFFDYGTIRIVLGDSATLANCTMLEPQPYTAWSASSVTITGNCGGLTAGGTGYLHVLDGSDTALASPIAVTIAG